MRLKRQEVTGTGLVLLKLQAVGDGFDAGAGAIIVELAYTTPAVNVLLHSVLARANR